MSVHVQYLSQSSVFADLSTEELARVAGICSERDYPGGEFVFVEHTEGDELFVILEGEVAIQLELACEEDGMPLVTLGPGAVFGELSVVDESPRSATARCLTDIKVLVLKKVDFDNLIESDHDLGFKLMRNLARLVSNRVRKANQKILDNVSWGMI